MPKILSYTLFAIFIFTVIFLPSKPVQSKFDRFIATTRGNSIDFDNDNNPDCVDLVQKYLLEVVEFPNFMLSVEDGWVFANKNPYEYFTKKDINEAKEGDIIYFRTHVAIYIDEMTMFDQNNRGRQTADYSPLDISEVIGVVSLN